MITFGERFIALFQHLRKRLEANPPVDPATSFDISKGQLSDIKKGRAKLSMDALLRLSSLHPEYNINWLLTGQGSMLIGDSTTTSATDISAIQEEVLLLKRTLKTQLESTERAHENADMWRERYEDCEKKSRAGLAVAGRT